MTGLLFPEVKEQQAESVATRTRRAGAERSAGWYERRGKRVFDVVFGSILLFVAVPVVALAIGFILVFCGRPVFYSGSRVGLNGREFRIVKLRTMRPDADSVLQEWAESAPELAGQYQRNFKVEDDPRVTPLGRFLRRTSIDELPQLWNVVRGEMSLVGPRPVITAEVEHRGEFKDLLQGVRPGMTGKWQVHGRGRVTYPERAEMEAEGVFSISFRGDIVMLAKTLLAVFKLQGS